MRTPEPAIPERVQRHVIGMHCAGCHAVVDVAPRQLLSDFIAGTPVHCPGCGASYDVWGRMVEQLEFGVFGTRYAAVGANVVTAQVDLRRDQPLVLDFQKLGIPDAAEIEEIATTPSGSEEGWLHPVFQKDPGPGQPASDNLVIYPVPVGAGAEENQLSILIVWTSQTAAANPAQEELLAGVRAAHRSDPLGAIISLNVAMELALGSAMNAWLEIHGIGRGRRKRFLGSEATYGSQLSVLLPVAAATAGLAPIPERPRAALARLRNLRNDVAHGGLQAATIGGSDIAECIAAAAVGVVYCDALRATLA